MLPAKNFLSVVACLTAVTGAPAVNAHSANSLPVQFTADLESANYVLARDGAVIGKLVGYVDRTDGTRDARIRIDFGVRPSGSSVISIPAMHLTAAKNQQFLDMSYAQFVNFMTAKRA